MGYGKASKKDLTGSISRIDAKEVQDFPAPSFESAIQGKVPGVVVASGSGRLGEAIQINIRGISSISANTQPLYVIDGLPVTTTSMGDPDNNPTNPIADIDPNDIASVEILKDASASAIYGARAANGVILITTKKGKNIHKTDIELNTFTGISNPARERHFMNAKQYLQLTHDAANNNTNLGVPLVLQPTYTYDSSATGPNKPARATVSATYAQIVSDLQTAISLLPTSNVNYRADMYSAHAMLSRVYLSMGQYANAAAQADTVIQSGNFTLAGTYDKTFNTDANSTEDVFAIQQSLQSNAGTENGGIVTFYLPYYGAGGQLLGGRGDAQVNPLYFDIFEPSDFRGTFFSQGTSISGFNGSYPNKWGAFYKTIPVIRLAEMYLTRGEGNLVAGTSIGDLPVNDINAVRNRAGASLLTAPAQTDFIEERFRELGFEGDRFWTEKRVQWNIQGLGFDNGKLILPIPQTEINVNQNLVQNAGY